MITAVDTNILLDILIPNQSFVDASAEALEDSGNKGSLSVCDAVYAELCVFFATRRVCDEFLESNRIQVESLSREASFAASRAWRVYRKQGGPRLRILTDFLIGAHAQVHASCLLSRDRGFYRRTFPSLKVIDPASRQR